MQRLGHYSCWLAHRQIAGATKSTCIDLKRQYIGKFEWMAGSDSRWMNAVKYFTMLLHINYLHYIYIYIHWYITFERHRLCLINIMKTLIHYRPNSCVYCWIEWHLHISTRKCVYFVIYRFGFCPVWAAWISDVCKMAICSHRISWPHTNIHSHIHKNISTQYHVTSKVSIFTWDDIVSWVLDWSYKCRLLILTYVYSDSRGLWLYNACKCIDVF